MDVFTARRRRHTRVLDGYRRLLVPVKAGMESEEAIDFAARLAAEHGASITAVAVVEVPAHLPPDAHMSDEEARAHAVLSRAAAVAERYGVSVSLRTVLARDAGAAIVAEARSRNSELIVVGAPRRAHANGGGAALGATVEHALRKAPCRVMVVGSRMYSRPAA
jgi:APA family basic amino acid/polyamine antiporter